MKGEWSDKIFAVTEAGFETLCLEIFRFQYANNIVYKNYTDAIGIEPGSVEKITQVPFLPISFFKSHFVLTTSFQPQVVFESSGTTDTGNSHHVIKDLSLYERSFTKCFEYFYGPVKDHCIIGLLPSYLERGNSSLVYMVDKLIGMSGHPQSGFYLKEYDRLAVTLDELERSEQKTLLIGVTFALLEFAEKFSFVLKHTTIMETGGMKGRREEMIRTEVHDILKKTFDVKEIHSEYGMTELLSQAYSKGGGIFCNSPWMKMLVRDDEDPLYVQSAAGSQQPLTGAINIIDLANIYSCSFIATDDVGKVYSDGSFETLGRMDNSDLRGCSLMVV